MLAKFSGLNPKGPYLSLENEKKIVLCSPTRESGRVKLKTYCFFSVAKTPTVLIQKIFYHINVTSDISSPS